MALVGPDRGRQGQARKIEVLVVDDHQMVRQGLRSLMEDEPDVEVAGEAASGREMMCRIRERDWDVVVLDITLPDASGLELIAEVKAVRPGLPVVILSMHPASEYADTALALGASGYVAKEDAAAKVVQAIRAAAGRARYVGGPLPEENGSRGG
ncbi:MAG: response regulator transcription factor [Actinobacteria bacterium]|nr:response regulator transcription factor [Actinomycetota bacterium]MDI6832106.1 response regulator transcription factor [Actinomycetota bacterium]